MDKVHIRNIFRLLVPFEGSPGQVQTRTDPFGVEFQNGRYRFDVKFVCTDGLGNIKEEPKNCFGWAKRTTVVLKNEGGGLYLRLKINQDLFENGAHVRSGTSTVRELFPKRRELENEYVDFEAVVPINWVGEGDLSLMLLNNAMDDSNDPLAAYNSSHESSDYSPDHEILLRENENYMVLYNGNAEVVGNFRALNFYKASDINLKEDVRLLEYDRDCRATLLQINGVEYEFKQGVSHATNKRFIGYIAQQIESVVPEAVQLIDGILHVDYESLIPYLSESIKQNYKDMQEISSDFERVKEMLDMLYNRFAGLGEKPKLHKKSVSSGRGRAIAWTIGAIAVAVIVAALVGLIYFESDSKPPVDATIANEREWLLELYHVLRPNDAYPPWNFTAPHCTWQGIMCSNTTGHIVKLDLNDMVDKRSKYSPTIPASIGNFSELELLDLSFNKIGSTIPESIRNLKNLKSLILSKNQLIGLLKLRDLRLYLNELNGPLEMLMQLPAVQWLDLDGNPFNSTLPQNISKSLVGVTLVNCSLSGTIPESWTQGYIAELNLARNKLRGSIPCFADTLLSLHASDNDFDGEFCGSSLRRLEDLKITHTKLTGVFDLPNTNLTKVFSIDVSFNSFTAFLPSSPDDMQGPRQCTAAYNSFKCPLPAWTEFQCKATCEEKSRLGITKQVPSDMNEESIRHRTTKLPIAKQQVDPHFRFSNSFQSGVSDT